MTSSEDLSYDKLYFFSGSADKKAGKGANEIVRKDESYEELNNCPHWRRILSNFHECPFVWRGRTYNTIEHAFQATKVGLADGNLRFHFCMESETTLSKSGGIEARKSRKIVELNEQQLADWEDLKDLVMSSVSRAKYEQCREARRVLALTGKAQLWHKAPRGQEQRFLHLELLREELDGYQSEDEDRPPETQETDVCNAK